MVAVVERAPAIAVASATAGQVLRPQGSAITLSLGSLGSCLRTAEAWDSFVITNTFFGGTTPLIRSTVSWRSDFLLNRASNCFGLASRLNGQAFPALRQNKNETILRWGCSFCCHILIKLIANCLNQPTDVFGYFPGHVRCISELCHAVDNCASDHDRITARGYLTSLFGVEMPNPTAMGRSVVSRISPVRSAMLSETVCCMPVTPSREI